MEDKEKIQFQEGDDEPWMDDTEEDERNIDEEIPGGLNGSGLGGGDVDQSTVDEEK